MTGALYHFCEYELMSIWDLIFDDDFMGVWKFIIFYNSSRFRSRDQYDTTLGTENASRMICETGVTRP